MPVDKKMIGVMIAYGAGVISKKYGLVFSSDVLNAATDFVVYVIIPLVGFLMHPKSTGNTSQTTNFNGDGPAI